MKQQGFLTITRRGFLGTAAATLFAQPAFVQAASKPNSNFNGVQIGTITYSYRGMPGSAEDILKYIVQCGISSVELMGEPVEQFAGVPSVRGGRRGQQLTDEQRKEIEKQREDLMNWRLNAPMDKFKALRKLYNDAGVNIHIVKFGSIGDASLSDGEIDYYFKVAKALGAKGITRELSEDAAKRLGPIADKHKIMIGFHNHTQITPTTYDGPILSYGKYLGINLDVGHYLAGTGESPIPLIKKYHDRIISLHIKDRKRDNGPNMPFGQGDTPVAGILQLLKKEEWPIHADIELEYEVPKDSDAITEITKCVQYCKKALA
ncbi:MAG: sugar phosphate isomerase/epimerase [Candidatus Hinthialibacter antarcticus]|nr:sugar phosphate isomerase/epimerase [Candidatus Hinthialibacter antarcticus]